LSSVAADQGCAGGADDEGVGAAGGAELPEAVGLLVVVVLGKGAGGGGTVALALGDLHHS
jgi:hypothetical protein